MEREWVSAGPLAQLPVGEPRLVRHGRRQAAVFLLEDGQLRAVDNRCPHEGYPLVQGTLCGRVLTCSYHNFKFDLDSGACLLGEERLQTWPVRVEDGTVWLDLTPPDGQAEQQRRWESLHAAASEFRVGQVAREVVRLLDLGVTPAQIASDAARWDAEHAEYGSSHALAVAAEALKLVAHLPGLSAARALVPIYEIAAEEAQRRPPHPVLPARDPGPEPTAPLRAAIESEDAALTESLIRGAVQRHGWASLEQPLLRIGSDHLSDYGHGLIYTTRAFDLLRADDTHAESILVGLGRGLVFATRDDLAPTWAPFRRRALELEQELPRYVHNVGRPDREALCQRLLGATPREGVEIVVDALREGASPVAVLDALSLAASERLLRFDLAVDLDPSVQDAWLDVTHLLTFADAVRLAQARCAHGELVRLLLQLARLVARVRPLEADRPEIPAPRAGSVEELCAALAARDPVAATALALRIDRRAALWPVMDRVLDELVVRPIFHAHAIKTPLAAFAESEAMGDPRPFAAAARFLAAPKGERRTAQRVAEAISLVAEGRPPRVLSL
jgi:nitrite reductase/ring-hydroxylating ferredoxin subunit